MIVQGKYSIFLICTFAFAFTFALNMEAFAGIGQQKAVDIFQGLSEQGLTFEEKMLRPELGGKSNQGIITYGAEKEGVDFKISHVMGPTTRDFKKFVSSLDYFYTNKNGRKFLIEFLGGLQSGEFRQEGVMDLEGNSKKINYDFLEGVNLEKLKFSSLENLLSNWLRQTENKPFSFLSQDIRIKILKGKLAGNNPKTARKVLAGTYKNWTPLFGLPEKYISDSGPAADYLFRKTGYEIRFKVQKSYGAFQKFLDWFKTVMRDHSDQPEKSLGPGNQRIVWPKLKLSASEQKKMDIKTGNLYKNVQAYVVLRGIAGNTGLTTAKWKRIQRDSALDTLKTYKGVIRAEHGRWPHGHWKLQYNWKYKTGGLELRAGTKDDKVQSFLTKAVASRVTTNDWEGMEGIGTRWKLIPNSLLALTNPWRFLEHEHALSTLSKRFKVSKGEMRQFIRNIRSMRNNHKINGAKRNMDLTYLVPLWRWDNAPYLSEAKKEVMHSLGQDFIHYIAKNGHRLSFDEIQHTMREWVKSTRVDKDIEDYLTPKADLNKNLDLHYLQHSLNGKKINVNEIDVGIEYTARLPVFDIGEYSKTTSHSKSSEIKFKNKRTWIRPKLGLKFDERETMIKNVATSLVKNLFGNDKNVEIRRKETKGNHGHGLGISYSFQDPEDPSRQWRVEWDGIVRNYDSKGKVISESLRKGVIEVVTPKFQPTSEDINAVFKAFQENSAIPDSESGGGHINIDLKAFEGNPEAFARFLTIFHKYRGLMALMFQNSKRLKYAEPVKLSSEFYEELKNFRGDDEEKLKKLLYDNKYFNPRVGRKTRYLQLDISSYYQDVIPAKYICEDYDIRNPTVSWKQQFRVKPDVRKMEFRLMNAPRNATESSLQLKFVRALLNKALNGKKPITGSMGPAFQRDYLENTDETFRLFTEMTKELGLSAEEYRHFVVDGIQEAKTYAKVNGNKTFEEKMEDFTVINDWGKSEQIRDAESAMAFDKAGPCKEETMRNSRDLKIVEEFKQNRMKGIKKVSHIRPPSAIIKKFYHGPRGMICFRRKYFFDAHLHDFSNVVRMSSY